MAITQTITVLPTPPSRADPANFDTRADSFLSALPTMQTQMNTWAGQANSTASEATGAVGDAEAAQAAAEAAQGTATTQAGIATTQAGIATTQAGTATTQAGIATTQAGTATTQAGIATTQAGIATTQAGIATTKAGEAAASAALAVDVVSGGLTSVTPAANKIPLADGAAKIALGWLDLTGYAPAADGVTNGNSHDHNGGDGGQIAYSSLSNLPTLGTAAATASTDYAPAAQGVTNGNSHDHNGGDGAQIAYSSLSSPPTLGTAAAKDIPATGDATTSQVVYGTDTRLSNSRAPTPHDQAETTITFTDVATGNASTTKHGFSPKATAPASGLRSVLAIDNGETVRSDKALFDATNPAALGTASPGSAMTAARRDHVHPLPSVSEKLTAARTYYVRTDGNDANTGLANTSGGAFLTIGHAMEVARGINLSRYDLTIAVGAGTFAENLVPGPYVTEDGTIIVSGAGVGSTIIDGGTGNCVECYGSSVWEFHNLTFTSSGDNGVEGNESSITYLVGVGFSSISGAVISCRQQASVYVWTSVAFTGTSENFINANQCGWVDVDASITLSGTCAFDEFVNATTGSYVGVFGSITGTATGLRYAVASNAVINTGGAGSTYLPGNVAGTTSTGGQYL